MRYFQRANKSAIKFASQALVKGNLVIFPTETVYGLGADALNDSAVTRIYEIKGRPKTHPVIVHFSKIEMMYKWAIEIPPYAESLANSFWPGPMTLILKKSKLASSLVTGGQDSVALRIPNHPIAIQLMKRFETLGGLGICAPSANRFGAVSPTSASNISKEISGRMNQNDLILNGGKCSIGIESTIISCLDENPVIYRLGFITKDMLNHSLNGLKLRITYADSSTGTRAPGGHKKHYAPNAKVLLNKETRHGDGFIALSSILSPKGTIRLSRPRNEKEFAKSLFHSLHLADELQLNRVVINFQSDTELGLAILERIHRAL